jgi:hypothetical protein
MRIALGLALLSAACIYACGSSNSSSPGGSAGADIGAAGDSSSAGKGNAHAGSGNSTGSGDAGEGGECGAPVVPIIVVSTAKPHAAGGLVAGGIIAHSKHFTGVFSLGAAPGGNGTTTSSDSQLRGGVLGASQK